MLRKKSAIVKRSSTPSAGHRTRGPITGTEATYALGAVAVGLGATLFMDLLALLLKHAFSVVLPSYCLVGRWFCHMLEGTFTHTKYRQRPAKTSRVRGGLDRALCDRCRLCTRARGPRFRQLACAAHFVARPALRRLHRARTISHHATIVRTWRRRIQNAQSGAVPAQKPDGAHHLRGWPVCMCGWREPRAAGSCLAFGSTARFNVHRRNRQRGVPVKLGSLDVSSTPKVPTR